MAKDLSTKEVKEKKKKGQNRFLKLLRDLKGDIKKVVWPSRKQVVNNSAIVLTLMVIVALFLAAVDYGVSFLVKLLLGIGL